MRRLIPWSLLTMLVLAAGLSAYLAYSETGLRWSFRLLQAQLPATLTAERLDGRLAGPLTINGLYYRNGAAEIRIEQLRLEWQPSGLLWGRVEISELLLEDSEIRISAGPAQSTDSSAGAAFDDPLVSLPVEIHLDSFESRNASLALPNREPLPIEFLGIRAVARSHAVTIENLRVRSSLLNVDANGSVPFSIDDPLGLNVRFDANLQERQWTGTTTFSGSPARIDALLALNRPIDLSAKGELSPFGRALRWHASLQSKPFSLQTLFPDSRPVKILTARIEGSGEGRSIEATGRINARDDEFGRWDAELRGTWDQHSWKIGRFLLTSPDTGNATRIEGQAGPASAARGNDRGIALELHWDNLAWPLTGPARINSPQGSAVLSGTPDNYHYQLEGGLKLTEIPPVQLALDGTGNRSGLEIEQLRGEFLDGQWRGGGKLAWRPSVAWDLRLEPRDIDPSLLRTGLDGRLDGSLQVSGGYDQRLSLTIDIDDLNGTFRQHPFDGRARIDWDGDAVDIQDLEVHSGGIDLTGNARFGGEWDIEWQLDATDFAAAVPDLDGRARSQGMISGPPDALQVDAMLTAEDLAYREYRIDRLEASADFILTPEGQWQASMLSSGTRIAGSDIGRVSANANGTTLDHIIQLRIEREDGRFEQQIHGSLDDGRWNAALRQGRLDFRRIGAWMQSQPARLAFSDRHIGLEDYCLSQDAAELCLRGEQTSENRWQAAVRWQDINLSRLDPLLAHRSISVGGLTDGTVEILISENVVGPINVGIHSGAGSVRYPLPPGNEMHSLEFTTAEFTASADDMNGAQATLEVILNERERLNAEFSLPEWEPEKPRPAPDDRIAGRLDIELNDPRVLTLFAPGMSPGPGMLRSSFSIAGTVESPRIDGEAMLDFEHLALTRLGTRFESVKLEAGIHDNDWTLEGESRIETGRLEITGAGELYDIEDWSGEIILRGEKLKAVRTPEAEITLSPTIALRVVPDDLEFSGSIAIPEAKLEPVIQQSRVQVSSDVVVTGKQASEPPPRTRAVHGRIQLILGERVMLAVMGFEGRLTGQLLVQLDRNGGLTGQGEIRVVDGKYQAYGQNLTINQGRVLYAGGPLDNPAVDIIASRMRGDIEVGVRITGTAERPNIELYSNPTMDDADVLSYLIIGRPMDEAGEGDGQLLYKAATSVALVGGEALAERIAQGFDLTEVSIETGDEDNSTALVLGKALSERLYVRYIRGILEEDDSSFEIRYELSDKWTLQSESGTRGGTGADILYTLER